MLTLALLPGLLSGLLSALHAADVPLPVRGEPDWMIAETDLAIASQRQMIVGLHWPRPGVQGVTGFRYSLRERLASGAWAEELSEGDLPLAFDPASQFAQGHEVFWLTDPSVEPDGTGGFVCVGLCFVRQTGTDEPQNWGAVLASRWSAAAGWTGWLEIEARRIPKIGGNERGFPLDKPFLTGGDGGDLYVTWWYRENDPDHPRQYGVRRSRDGGATWSGGVLRDDEAGGAPIEGWFAPQPHASPGTPLYVCYTLKTSPPEHRFVVGWEGADGELHFRHVRDANGNPLALHLTKASPFLSFPGERVLCKAVPQIAVDPLGVRELYVAWHDDPGDDGVVDAFVAGIDWTGDAWAWGPTVRLDTAGATAGGATDDHADQFLPCLTVDAAGVVAVTFYDDRRFAQADGDADARYDLVHALSVDRGASYHVRRVPPADGGDAFWDHARNHPKYKGPLEYGGVEWTRGPTGALEIWCSATGTDAGDPGLGSALWNLRLR